MICPSCNQKASSFLRNAFTLQGVSVMQSIKGFLRCRNCKTMLRVSKFKIQLWYLFAGMVCSIILLYILAKHRNYAIETVITYWIVICMLFILVFMYGIWKYSVLEKADEEKQKV